MVGSTMRGGGEYVGEGRGGRQGEGKKAWEDRIGEPLGKSCGQEDVGLREGGRVSLKAPTGEVLPGGKGCGIDLKFRSVENVISEVPYFFQ